MPTAKANGQDLLTSATNNMKGCNIMDTQIQQKPNIYFLMQCIDSHKFTMMLTPKSSVIHGYLHIKYIVLISISQ